VLRIFVFSQPFHDPTKRIITRIEICLHQHLAFDGLENPIVQKLARSNHGTHLERAVKLGPQDGKKRFFLFFSFYQDQRSGCGDQVFGILFTQGRSQRISDLRDQRMLCVKNQAVKKKNHSKSKYTYRHLLLPTIR
jgi:hypothetical protein